MKNEAFLATLEGRRSVRPQMFTDDGPSRDELLRILRIGMRVPDHKRLAPWRFIVIEGEERTRFGDVMARACVDEPGPEPSQARLDTERARFLRAPVVVAVISSRKDNPSVPEWEQILSAGAAGLNLCLAANASGFATCWITEWVAYNKAVWRALGLGPRESVAGFIYMGRSDVRQDDRERPDVEDKVTFWTPANAG